MTASDIEQAERHSRTRALLMATMAVVLLVQALIGFNDAAPGAIRPYVRHFGWALMILLWLGVLATGGGLRLRQSVRRVMNDEVALAHRGAALQAGFWTAMLAGLALSTPPASSGTSPCAKACASSSTCRSPPPSSAMPGSSCAETVK